MNIVSYLVAIAILVIILKLISLPFRIIVKFIFNSIIGGIVLGICYFFGIIVNVYWWTVVLTGLFGLPGFLISMVITVIL